MTDFGILNLLVLGAGIAIGLYIAHRNGWMRPRWPDDPYGFT